MSCLTALKSKHWVLVLTGAVIIGVFLVVWLVKPLDEPPVNESTSAASLEQLVKEGIPKEEYVSGRWLFTGEVFWGRQIEKLAQASDNPYKFPFSGFKTFSREDYDAWIGQLECPSTTQNIPISVQISQLKFNCPPEYLGELSKWYDALSLANNHTDNANFVAGLNETRKLLGEADIQPFGHFDPSVLEDICEVVGLPLRVMFTDGSEKKEYLPVALCGYNYVFGEAGPQEIEEITRYSKYFLTIVSPHMGTEYVPKADQLKTDTFRSMIDQGADMVLASHPHWVQNTEVYKGKLIMYSLGNFLFDQEWSAEVKRGVALDLTIGTSYDENLAAWLELGNKCLKYKDSCLRQAKTKGLQKPVFTSSYELVSSFHEDGITSLAPKSIDKLNISRTNWKQTKLELNPHD